MGFYDIFNGDADGLCALQQLRLHAPRAATVVTGPKRDIALLERVFPEADDSLTVLDIAVAPNRQALDRVLATGASVEWFDHHMPGPLPDAPTFTARIDTATDVCTSVLVDRHLAGRHRPWAVAGAFGDNLADTAKSLAGPLDLTEADLDLLRRLGECLNYNAYGDSAEELRFHPAEIHERMRRFADPWAFSVGERVFGDLERVMADDWRRAEGVAPLFESASIVAHELPDKPWSRRVSGLFANRVATSDPARAHAVLTPSRGTFTVSIRAPLSRPEGADRVAGRFPGGGGRPRAAGINGLPPASVPDLLEALSEIYGTGGPAALKAPPSRP